MQVQDIAAVLEHAASLSENKRVKKMKTVIRDKINIKASRLSLGLFTSTSADEMTRLIRTGLIGLNHFEGGQ